jgi:hypothetical protein
MGVIIIKLIYFFIIMSIRSQTIRSLTDAFPDDLPELEPLSSGIKSNSSGFFSYLASIQWTTWLIIILIMALLGINIFLYLAKGTEIATYIVENLFAPILKWFGYNVAATVKTTIDVGATGTQAAIDIVSETTKGAVTGAVAGAKAGIENTRKDPTATIAEGSHEGVPVQNAIQQSGSKISWENDNLEKALSHAQYTGNINPDDSLSSIQSSSNKGGWCFIGEQSGIRACAEVGVNDLCMSGDVFPTRDICMNPNLRT